MTSWSQPPAHWTQPLSELGLVKPFTFPIFSVFQARFANNIKILPTDRNRSIDLISRIRRTFLNGRSNLSVFEMVGRVALRQIYWFWRRIRVEQRNDINPFINKQPRKGARFRGWSVRAIPFELVRSNCSDVKALSAAPTATRRDFGGRSRRRNHSTWWNYRNRFTFSGKTSRALQRNSPRQFKPHAKLTFACRRGQQMLLKRSKGRTFPPGFPMYRLKP